MHCSVVLGTRSSSYCCLIFPLCRCVGCICSSGGWRCSLFKIHNVRFGLYNGFCTVIYGIYYFHRYPIGCIHQRVCKSLFLHVIVFLSLYVASFGAYFIHSHRSGSRFSGNSIVGFGGIFSHRLFFWSWILEHHLSNLRFSVSWPWYHWPWPFRISIHSV